MEAFGHDDRLEVVFPVIRYQRASSERMFEAEQLLGVFEQLMLNVRAEITACLSSEMTFVRRFWQFADPLALAGAVFTPALDLQVSVVLMAGVREARSESPVSPGVERTATVKPRLTALSKPLLTPDPGCRVAVRVRVWVARAVVKGLRSLPPGHRPTRCLAVSGRCCVCKVRGLFPDLMTELRPDLRRKQQAKPCAHGRPHQKPDRKATSTPVAPVARSIHFVARAIHSLVHEAS